MAAAHVVVASVDAPSLSEADAHHLRRVLRLRDGSEVTATDGRGGLVACRLSADGLDPVAAPAFVDRPAPAITIALAPVKGDRPEWAVQKLTELGVDRIVLMHTDRSVVRWAPDRAAGHLERLRAVAVQAVMQSRRCWLPEVDGMVSFESLAGAGSGGVAMAAPGGDRPSLEWPTLLIGPEGGWTAGELSAGLPRVGLGDGILRAETAAVAAGVLLAALRGGQVGSR